MPKPRGRPKGRRSDPPVSLHPLGLEEALSGLMQVTPEKEKQMAIFNDGTSVRVHAEARNVPAELWEQEGVVVKAIPAPGIAQRRGQWEPAYEVRFESLGQTHIIEEQHLDAV